MDPLPLKWRPQSLVKVARGGAAKGVPYDGDGDGDGDGGVYISGRPPVAPPALRPPSARRRRRRRRRMVRGRVELRRIEERGRRQVSFAKRRKGLLKKAAELGVLCDAHVALLVFSPFDGAVHHFAAPSTMENIIERYQNFSSAHKKVDDKCLPEQSNSKVSRGTRNGRPNFADMSIDESSISELTVEQLGQIEMKLEDALRSTMARKTQLMSDTIGKLQEKGKSLTDERSLMDVTLLQDKDNIERGETGSKPSSGRMDGMLRLSIGANSNGNISLHHRLGDKHTGKRKLTIDLNIS